MQYDCFLESCGAAHHYGTATLTLRTCTEPTGRRYKRDKNNACTQRHAPLCPVAPCKLSKAFKPQTLQNLTPSSYTLYATKPIKTQPTSLNQSAALHESRNPAMRRSETSSFMSLGIYEGPWTPGAGSEASVLVVLMVLMIVSCYHSQLEGSYPIRSGVYECIILPLVLAT